MIDQNAGVNPNTRFSSFDKWQTIRTDGDEKNCRIPGLAFLSFDAFKRCCIKRQGGDHQKAYMNGTTQHFECNNCKCGVAIMTGKRKRLPLNVAIVK